MSTKKNEEKKESAESKLEGILDKLIALPEKIIDKFMGMSLLKQILFGFLIVWFVKYIKRTMNEFKRG